MPSLPFSASRSAALSRWLLPLFLCLLVWALCLPSPAPAQVFGRTASTDAAVVQTPHVRAELVAHVPDGLQAGTTAWLGLLIAHEPGWHTYWKNPGDTGLPTELQWQLPAGMTAGDIQWPAPEQFRIGDMVNYGYEGAVLLPVPLNVATPDVSEATATFTLEATWLVCQLECIPESGTFRLELPRQGSSALHTAEFTTAWQAHPHSTPEARAQVQAQGQRLQWRVEGLPAALHGQPLELYVEQGFVVAHGTQPDKGWPQQWQDGVWLADVPLSPDRDAAPAQLAAVLRPLPSNSPAASEAAPSAWRVVADVTQPWTSALTPLAPGLQAALAQTGTEPSTAPPPLPAPDGATSGIASILLLALLGGALLNLMPCVFPVLAIKVLGIAGQGSSTDTASRRRAAWAYGAGVVLSFALMGGAILAMRALGSSLGWGFQLQSPWFVALMAVLFTLIGLSLAGVFHLSSWAPQRLAGAQPRSPLLHAFLSGVLAVLIASPCTGPFMGAALGATLGLPAPAALLVFVVLGIGMAVPFMLLVWFPTLLGYLPRPGAWMATFQKAMAFPMFATVAWLLWVLAHQTNPDSVAALLFALWGMGFALWLWSHRPGSTAVAALNALWLLVLVAVLAITGYAWQGFHRTQSQPWLAQSHSQTDTAAIAQPWQPWSADAVTAALARQQPVFVDFTASWCITCQYNKFNALSDDAVLAAFAQQNVLLLRADWTRQDPAISAALRTLGRTGVPTYALYQPAQPPLVLTEILDRHELRQTIVNLDGNTRTDAASNR